MSTIHDSGVAPRILFVCLGNICRSPTAEGVVRDLARGRGIALHTDSAGTGDWHVGAAPDSRARAEARRRGHDIADLRARQVTARDFDRFDLILAMDAANRRDLEAVRPPGNATPVELFMAYAGEPDTDVPDPYVEGGFDRAFDMISRAGNGLLDRLHPPRGA